MDIHALVVATERFAEIDPTMQVATMLTFLYVARRGTCSVKDIEIELGLSGAAASRNISYWTTFKVHDVPGVGFVDRHEDPRDRRYKVVSLTPAGQKFYDSLRSRHRSAA